MARPLRIEYSNAVYHVTSRGNARGEIFVDNVDRTLFLELLAVTVARHNWLCHAYVLMDNHYHLMVETPDANLSRGMRHLNGVYTQAFNRAHHRSGHVFQGRFKALVVEKDAYLLNLCRYIVRNPVAAGMVRNVRDWRWSSYRATSGLIRRPDVLTTDWILQQFSGERAKAEAAYRVYVNDGRRAQNPWDDLATNAALGSEAFIADVLRRIERQGRLKDVPRAKRFAGRPPLNELLAGTSKSDRPARAVAMHEAVTAHGYTLSDVARAANVDVSTVSRVLSGMPGR